MISKGGGGWVRRLVKRGVRYITVAVFRDSSGGFLGCDGCDD
jgi:hypothetical protein